MKSLEQLKKEYKDYKYLASGLTYEHQATVRNGLTMKAEIIKEEIKQREKLLCEEYKYNNKQR